MATGTFFVLLMFFGEPSGLKEYTIRESMSECLSAKRTIERTLRGGRSKQYGGSDRDWETSIIQRMFLLPF